MCGLEYVVDFKNVSLKSSSSSTLFRRGPRQCARGSNWLFVSSENTLNLSHLKKKSEQEYLSTPQKGEPLSCEVGSSNESLGVKEALL